MTTTALAPSPLQRLTTPKPLYAQVRDMLLQRVKAGEWAAGETLPNEFVLSEAYSVSIGTIRRAVAELETCGVLVRKQGRGTFVGGHGPTALQDKFARLVSPGGERLQLDYELARLIRRAATPEEATALRLGGGEVFEIVQHVTIADRSVGIEVSVLDAARFPRLDTQLRYGQNLYPVIADYGSIVTRVDEAVGVTNDADMARRLGLAFDAALLTVTSTAFALDGEPVEYRYSHYAAAKVVWSSK